MSPVLILARRRPETVREAVSVIREAHPVRVYVVRDGANADRSVEEQNVAETRRVSFVRAKTGRTAIFPRIDKP